MLIEDLRSEDGDGIATFRATVDWENRSRDSMSVYFVVDESDAWRVSLNPDAFRIPGAVVAMRDHEHRIAGGGPMCPVLRDGLKSSLAWISRWSTSPVGTPDLDFPLGCAHPVPQDAGAAAGFVSGGVDSTALIVANHRAHGEDDPLRVSVGIVVIGIQSHRWVDREEIKDQLAAARDDLSTLADATGIDIVPVATNIRMLNDNGTFWKYEFQGAVLAGVAHLFAPTVSNVSIASTWEIAHLDNWGSHPLLDHGYGNHSLRIWHELAHVGRLEKTRLVAEQPALLKGLNVCNKAEAGDANCGRCEKCVRTKLALETMAALKAGPEFVVSSTRPEDLKLVRILDRGLEGEFAELVDPLREAGHADLASAVEKAIRRGRLLRRPSVHRMRVLGSRILPRSTRERLFGVAKTPR